MEKRAIKSVVGLHHDSITMDIFLFLEPAIAEFPSPPFPPLATSKTSLKDKYK
jgi:hypothetical protein